MIELNQKIKLDPEVIATELENNEAVLLHLGTKKYYSLNETGLRIWQMLSEGASLLRVHETLQNEYDIAPDHAEKCILDLTNELLNEKLLTILDEQQDNDFRKDQRQFQFISRYVHVYSNGFSDHNITGDVESFFTVHYYENADP